MRASRARKGRKSSGKMRVLVRRGMRGSALCGRSRESAEDEYMKSGRAGASGGEPAEPRTPSNANAQAALGSHLIGRRSIIIKTAAASRSSASTAERLPTQDGARRMASDGKRKPRPHPTQSGRGSPIALRNLLVRVLVFISMPALNRHFIVAALRGFRRGCRRLLRLDILGGLLLVAGFDDHALKRVAT